jgi:hypothetical protein
MMTSVDRPLLMRLQTAQRGGERDQRRIENCARITVNNERAQEHSATLHASHASDIRSVLPPSDLSAHLRWPH